MNKCKVCGQTLNKSEPDFDDVYITNSGFDDENQTCYGCHCAQLECGDATTCENCGECFTPNHLLDNPVNGIKELCPYCKQVWCE